MEFNYNEFYNNYKDMRVVRNALAEDALKIGVKKSARKWKTTTKTVRKWRNRYEKDGFEALKDRSRRPKTSLSECPLGFDLKLQMQQSRRFATTNGWTLYSSKTKTKFLFPRKPCWKRWKSAATIPKSAKNRAKKRICELKSRKSGFSKIRIWGNLRILVFYQI